MRPIIEFCTSNMHHGTDEVMRKLAANPDYDVVEYGCMGNCGECYDMPYALLNGDFITAPTADELYEEIVAKIKEAEELYNLFAE